MSASTAPPLSDTDAIIRHRVLARDAEFLSLVKRYQAYTTSLQRYHAANSSPSPTSSSSPSSSPAPSLSDVTDAHQRLLHEVDVLSFTLARHSFIHTSLDSELLTSNTTATAILSHTAALQAQLLDLRAQLLQAQRERRQREEYEGVVQQLEAMESRGELEAVVRGLEGDLEGLEEERRRLEEEEDRKRKRFSLLLTALHAVKEDWEAAEPKTKEETESPTRSTRNRRGGGKQQQQRSHSNGAAAPAEDAAMAVG